MRDGPLLYKVGLLAGFGIDISIFLYSSAK